MATNTQIGALFEERQKFRQTWLWALVLLPTVVIVPLALLAPKPPGPAGVIVTIAVPLALAVAIGIFASATMTTLVTPGELRLRYVPFFVDKRIAIADIARFTPLHYSFWSTGYGIHYSKYGWVYNVDGSEGVQVELRSGKRFLMGTQRLVELTAALEQAGAKRA